MGVLACDRKGCDNIMCDRYSHEYGYICWECFCEMEESKDFKSIEEFMNTEKGHKINSSDNSYDNLNEIFEMSVEFKLFCDEFKLH